MSIRSSDRRPRRRLSPPARRQAILDAASRRFAVADFSEVSLVEIADDAGASQALVHKYFDGKRGVYREVVGRTLDELAVRQREADGALPPNTSARDRVRTWLLVYLDAIAAEPQVWLATLRHDAADPASDMRRGAEAARVEQLRSLLGEHSSLRHDFALWGYFGFLDGACAEWIRRGCPSEQRWSLVDACLGALEGALGDWGG